MADDYRFDAGGNTTKDVAKDPNGNIFYRQFTYDAENKQTKVQTLDASGIVTGTRAEGQSCDTDSDCDRSNGVECVRRAGARGGICQVPEVVGAGQACTDPAQTCPEGFFCDGSNCIAAPEIGEPCQNDVQCEPVGYCSTADVCVARLQVGSNCTSDDECESQLCYAANGQRTCADLIRLSPAEDFCSDLR